MEQDLTADTIRISPEDIVVCISLVKASLPRQFWSFLIFLSHPTKEREYHDNSGQEEDMFSIDQVQKWIESDEVHINNDIRDCLRTVKKLLNKHNASYFRIIK